ncbi:MAG: hypothetical protein HYU27_08060 [Acidobacteria bacterium]|nr:hypothetical protein [Acidobacteriota bacterium]
MPRPQNYTGSGSTPSIVNGYNSLGETMGTPTGLRAILDAIEAVASDGGAYHYYYGADRTSIELGDEDHPVVDFVDGDLVVGPVSGYGLLVVTGRLTMSGNFSWMGLVLVVGDGEVDFSGGGNGADGNVITGSLFVARIFDHGPITNGEVDPAHDHQTSQPLLSTLGSPYFNWGGGGTNDVQFDHCWADNLMDNIPFTPPTSTRPLKVLSFRLLPY